MPGTQLTDLPPEILLRIASHLSLRPLLSFSRGSHTCHALHCISLRQLSFGVFPTRLASHINIFSSNLELRDIINGPTPEPDTIVPKDRTVRLVIPKADELDMATLVTFHDALTSSVIGRYAMGLRILDLSVWRLDRCIARALAKCSGLKSLTLRSDDPYVRRAGSLLARELLREEDDVYSIMKGAWCRLETLRLEGSKMEAENLLELVSETDNLKELWITRCPNLARGIWHMFDEWEICPRLSFLGLVDSGMVKTEDLGCLEHFNLEVLSLQECANPNPQELEEINSNTWKIKTFIPPQRTVLGEMEVDTEPIEIDINHLHMDSGAFGLMGTP